MSIPDIEKIRTVLTKHDPIQGILYGSRAIGTYKPNSDYDIMVFFKKSRFPFKETAEQRFTRFNNLAYELKEALGKPVDLVVMKYTGKWINTHPERDVLFFNQVRCEAMNVFVNRSGAEMCDMSEKIGLYKTK
jgi:predicted nucleotidyltransferase